MAKVQKKNKTKSSPMNKSENDSTNNYIPYNGPSKSGDLKQLYEKDMLYYHLFVNDFGKMKNFYQNILEFEPAGEAPPEFGWCDFYLPVEGARLGLFKTDRKLENTNAAPSLNIAVKNLEKTHKIVKEKNIEVTDIQDIPDQISMFDFRDPEGNRISFLAEPRIKNK